MTTRQFRLMLICCILAALSGGVLSSLLVQAAAPAFAQSGRVLTATRFVLVDSRGQERATLEVLENGLARLEFNNAAGERLVLGQHEDGREVLRMLGTDDVPRAVLRAHRDGMSQLTMFGNDGKSAAIMAVYDQGELLLGLRDKSGETVWKKP